MFIRVVFGVRVEPYCARGRCYGFREGLRVAMHVMRQDIASRVFSLFGVYSPSGLDCGVHQGYENSGSGP